MVYNSSLPGRVARRLPFTRRLYAVIGERDHVIATLREQNAKLQAIIAERETQIAELTRRNAGFSEALAAPVAAAPPSERCRHEVDAMARRINEAAERRRALETLARALQHELDARG